MRTLRIGLLGQGQVGTGFYSLLSRKNDFFRREIGVDVDIARIAVKNKSNKRSVRVPASLFAANALQVVRDPSIDVIIELVGGTQEARILVKEALRQGKHVITANKA